MVSLADGLLIPFVNLYMVHSLGFQPALAGAILGLSGLGLVLGQLPGGALADRFGYRRVIVIGFLVAGLANLSALVTRNPIVFGISYGIALFASGSMSPAFYQVASQIKTQSNLRSVGTLIAAQNGGIAMGALLAWPLVASNMHEIFLAAAFLDAGGALMAVWLVRASQAIPPAPRTPFRLSDWIYLPPRGKRLFWPIALAGFLTGVLYSQMWSTVPTVWVKTGGSASIFSLLWFFNGASIFLVERRISRGLERCNPFFWLAGASVIYGLAVGIFNIGMSLATLCASFAVLTLAEMLYEPLPPVFYATAAPGGMKARYQGAGNLANALGIVLGPVIGELLLQGGRQQFVWTLMAVLGVLAAVSVLSARRSEGSTTFHVQRISQEARE